MGSPKTREIAGLVWTYDHARNRWATPCGLAAYRWSYGQGIWMGYHVSGSYRSLTAACKAEVAHREATRAAPTLTAADDTATENGPAAQSASPTLEPEEIDRMLGEATPPAMDEVVLAPFPWQAWPDPPAVWTATPRPDPIAEEREAQRRDAVAYYRNLAGWALAALVLAALCSGVLRG